MREKPRIVVVGGGFAGLHLIRQLEQRLRRDEADVLVLDRNDYHLFTPLLYQVATGELPPHAVAYPLRQPTSHAGFRFRRTEVQGIDLDRRIVITGDGEVPYDHVVVVPGSSANDFGLPGVRSNALPLKDLADAQRIRKHILGTFQRAATFREAADRKVLLTFVVVGAGPTGVEVASSMRDLMDHSLRPMYPEIDFAKEVSIVLIDGAERPLTQMDQRLSLLATKRLAQQRVTLVMRTPVSEVQPGIVRTRGGAVFHAGTIVWSGGVEMPALVRGLDLPKAQDGRIRVDDHFRAGARRDVWSFGDAAYFIQDGKPLAQQAQVAVLEAPRVAGNLARAVRGEPPVAYRHYPKGDLIALGRRQAGAQIGDRVFGGLPAWSVWRVNYLTQLLGIRNRTTLLTEWTLSYLSSRMVADTP
ncbi:MAG: NAD(P)/FAD-dependent oxidoreductase [Chloroflexi bacterium]|nr:NAD(P)/FAD-dependent oxidoreductase [Chloroflexota bacterium]